MCLDQELELLKNLVGTNILAREREGIHGHTALVLEVSWVSACHLLPPGNGTEGKKEMICLMEFVQEDPCKI